MSQVSALFKDCVHAISNGELIVRTGPGDKEFHFQNWFENRLKALDLKYDSPGRNTYPDFTLVHFPEGYELKGLAYPGREADYDCNSQLPRGEHNGRGVYYVFGRYPAKPDGNSYPVLDLVLCHGSLLNADSDYEHENKSFRGFGSYGDILVRDRKMYVAPTPFALANGTPHHRTLIVPADEPVDNDLVQVGELIRQEVEEVVVQYAFDLKTNVLTTQKMPNPNAGKKHVFRAYRVPTDPTTAVSLKSKAQLEVDVFEALDALAAEKVPDGE